MAWAKKQYSHRQYNEAAKRLMDSDISEADKDEAYQIVNNWRAIHAFPLNTFRTTLKKVSKKFDINSIVAQRTKRLPSIKHKLDRMPTMNLCQMQDIGGCRVIMEDIEGVKAQVDFYKMSRSKHVLVREDNYITKPKNTGYRGIHLIYSYQSSRNDNYNGLKIEIQFRTLRQHYWSTAVETAETIRKEALKSNKGSADWLMFFRIISNLIAIKEGTPTDSELKLSREQLAVAGFELLGKLNVLNLFYGFAIAITEAQNVMFNDKQFKEDAYYYLLRLFYKDGSIQSETKVYAKTDIEKANKDYIEAEKSIGGKWQNVVLVSVDSIESLFKAYPNYFLDTTNFIKLITELLNDNMDAFGTAKIDK